MSTSFTEDVKESFAGNLSEAEKQVCATFRALIHAALRGQIGFKDAMADLWFRIYNLRELNYDVEKAVAAGQFDSASSSIRSTVNGSAPLSTEERTFLEDTDGLIDWVTRNGVSFSVVLQVLGHDVSELSRDDFQLEKTLGPGRRVLPKVTGWAKRNIEPVGEAEEQS